MHFEDIEISADELSKSDRSSLPIELRTKILQMHKANWSQYQIMEELGLKRHQVRQVVTPGYQHNYMKNLEAAPTELTAIVPQAQPEQPVSIEAEGFEEIDMHDPVDRLLGDMRKASRGGGQGLRIDQLGDNAVLLLEELENQGYIVKLTGAYVGLMTSPEAYVNDHPVRGMFDPTRKKHGFSVITDTHFGGYQAQPEFVLAVAEEAARRGYNFVAHVGDHLDGPPSMHKGFEYELALKKADDQVDFAVSIYEQFQLPLVGITGNHDGSYFKASGLDVGRLMDERCEQFTHLGPISGWIEGPNGDPNFMRLYHPGDGCSYALSYKDQKTAEFLALSDKASPTGFHFTGHYHKMNHMRGPNGARYFLAPASCATTAFMEAKRLVNQAGAYHIEFTLDKHGKVDRVMVEDVYLHADLWTKCDYTGFMRRKREKPITRSRLWTP